VIRTHLNASGSARRRGISLLVILVALSLIAVLAVVAIPLYFSRAEVTLENACNVLKHDLRAAQTWSTLAKCDARYVFDEDGWRAVDATGRPIVAIGETHPIARRFSQDAVFDGVRIVGIDCGTDRAIAIDRDGQLDETGEIEFEFGGERRRVMIEKGAGYIFVESTGSTQR
jgi:hypothetical protein